MVPRLTNVPHDYRRMRGALSVTIILSVVAIMVVIGVAIWYLRAGTSSDVTAPSSTREESTRSAGQQPESAGVLKNAVPDITLQDLEGQPVRLHDFVGTPLVINTWATWCPFCVDELPDFASVQQEFGEQVTIVAINRTEPAAKARNFVLSLEMGDQLVFLLDPRDQFYQAIGGFSMPETLFISADGELVFHKRGPMQREEIRQRVADLVDASK